MQGRLREQLKPAVRRAACAHSFVCAWCLRAGVGGNGIGTWLFCLANDTPDHRPSAAPAGERFAYPTLAHFADRNVILPPPHPPPPHPTQHARTDTTASHIAFYFACVCGCVLVGLAAAVRVDPDRRWVNSKKAAGQPASSFASSPPPSQPLPPPTLPPRVKGLGLNHDPPPPWP